MFPIDFGKYTWETFIRFFNLDFIKFVFCIY